MTRSSRYCGEGDGRSVSYHSPHSRKWCRKKDNAAKRSIRCRQRSDIASGDYKTPGEYITPYHPGSGICGFKGNSHQSNGKSHLPNRSGLQWQYWNESLPEYTWDFNNEIYRLNIDCCRKMKQQWDALPPSKKIEVFENIGNNKTCLNYARELSYNGATLQQFATFVHYVEEELKEKGISIDVAIKRILRRGNTKKFVSHRNYKEKYAF